MGCFSFVSLSFFSLATPEYVPVDGTIAECDRVGDSEGDYSGKARRHGVNIQAVTGSARRSSGTAAHLPPSPLQSELPDGNDQSRPHP
ncbi:transposase IS4 family protein [Streptomyces sp. 769]|nr:transposase IS4 family protein [Streptomyces sp. 769]AJC61859.1 transposase IS4 family protein [Streptomyces sp. 769]